MLPPPSIFPLKKLNLPLMKKKTVHISGKRTKRNIFFSKWNIGNQCICQNFFHFSVSKVLLHMTHDLVLSILFLYKHFYIIGEYLKDFKNTGWKPVLPRLFSFSSSLHILGGKRKGERITSFSYIYSPNKKLVGLITVRLLIKKKHIIPLNSLLLSLEHVQGVRSLRYEIK